MLFCRTESRKIILHCGHSQRRNGKWLEAATELRVLDSNSSRPLDAEVPLHPKPTLILAHLLNTLADSKQWRQEQHGRARDSSYRYRLKPGGRAGEQQLPELQLNLSWCSPGHQMRRSRKGWEIFWRGIRTKGILWHWSSSRLLSGEKDLFFGKEALLHFEEMCQEGVSELHPQRLGRRRMLAQVQWRRKNQIKSLMAAPQINVILQFAEDSVCFSNWLLNLGVGTEGWIQTTQ